MPADCELHGGLDAHAIKDVARMSAKVAEYHDAEASSAGGGKERLSEIEVVEDDEEDSSFFGCAEAF